MNDMLAAFMSAKEMIVSDRVRIANLSVNSQLASKIEYKGEAITITFSDRVKGRRQYDHMMYVIPLEFLTTQQLNQILSYKTQNENNNNIVSQRSSKKRSRN